VETIIASPRLSVFGLSKVKVRFGILKELSDSECF
jgi:hypothetical protein